MSPVDRIRVVVADDHPLVREGLRTFLTEREVQVVGEAADGAEAVRLALALRPDVVLMDLRMPALDGIEATRRLRSAGAPCRVVILTSYGEEERAADAVRAGAVGYLLKDVARRELLQAVRDAAVGRATLHPVAREQLRRDRLGRRPPEAKRAPMPTLTRREREVLALVASGESNKRIAGTLGLSEGTVKGYVSAAYEKIGARDRAQAVLWAVRNGLAS
ncbi:response regulator receiver [Gemmatirosa kalamazoonensis]|uniref:Response regulator receiver n=1 Tax=Gemmatirosa kalamazoonensis TaxID=861299 RepID=W0RB09_9BACT|nr:response regulator transcription factor [Gemmatirosa kalamazoonensis]AHG87652.1 response regulator receiver [Gemmatirosa kalamazoonensis]